VRDPKTLDPKPGVAEKWEISPDGKKYTFHLRDCEWSDGKKVTAQDYAYAWVRVLDPNTPTDYASQMYYLKGGEAFNLKKTNDPSTVGVRAKDDKTLEVELENPCTYFLDLCAFFTYYPVRKDLMERHGTNWTRPENIAVNGPFKLKEWKANESLTVERNPKYWNAAVVKLPYVQFLPLENRLTAWGLYKDGKCDWVTSLPLEQIEEIIKRPDYHGDTYLGTYFYGFNVTDGALKDRRVRKALCLAIDRETIVTKITKQGQKPAYWYTPPIWPEVKSPRFDVKD
jgi:oligopeptide transport system substrate-binding protein